MIRFLSLVGQAALLVFAGSPALAAPLNDATELIERMAGAMSQMSYQGTFVYMRGDSVETMRITHVVDEDGVRERLYSVDGPQREIIRDRNGVRCVLADDRSVMEDPMVAGAIYPDIPLSAGSGEDRYYEFNLLGRGRMAGHQADRIMIRPVDRYRYGYELWLEENSGLLLKWVLYSNLREPLAKLVFTDLRFGSDIEMSELESTTPAGEFKMLESPMPSRATVHTAPLWLPASLPKGFRLTTHNRVEENGQDVFEHLVYSDGLASVSVYVEDPDGRELPASGISKVGTAFAYSGQVSGKLVTVIGEVPSITVQQIGESVRPATGAD